MVYGLSSLIMGIIAGSEWLVIGLIIMIMIMFGSRKIPEFSRSFGKARSEFNKAKIEAERPIQKVKEPLTSNINNREKLEIAANTLGIDSANKSDEELRTMIKSEICKDKQVFLHGFISYFEYYVSKNHLVEYT